MIVDECDSAQSVEKKAATDIVRAMDITPFSLQTTAIDGLTVMQVKEVRDERGVIREFFRASTFVDAAVPVRQWQQMNITESKRGAIRGLHGEAMNKLVGIIAGEAFGAYVDVRSDSPTVGNVVTVPIPAGSAYVAASMCTWASRHRAISSGSCIE